MMSLSMGPEHSYHLVCISAMTSVLYSLLGPSVSLFNVTMNSQNFEHNLTWEGGDNTGTPTYYRVMYLSDSNLHIVKECSNITRLFCNLTKELKDNKATYMIMVEQFTGSRALNSVLTFTPYIDTSLGPSEFNISACQNCINVKIQFPSILLKEYTELFCTITVTTVNFKEEPLLEKKKIRNESFNTVIRDLHPNRNYCVSVDVSASLNKKSAKFPSKCVTIISKNEGHAAFLIFCFIPVPVVVGLVLVFIRAAGFICLRKGTWPKVLEISYRFDYSLFESHLENVHTIHVIPKAKKKIRDDSDDDNSESDEDEGDPFYTTRVPLGKVSNSSSNEDFVEQLSVGCLSNTPDSQTVQPLNAEAENLQYDIKKEESITSQVHSSSSDVNSASIPELEISDCLNINLNTILLGTPNTSLDASTTFISYQPDAADLQEPLVSEVSEPKHLTDTAEVQNFIVHNFLKGWQDCSETEETESSDSELDCIGEYMKR